MCSKTIVDHHCVQSRTQTSWFNKPCTISLPVILPMNSSTTELLHVSRKFSLCLVEYFFFVKTALPGCLLQSLPISCPIASLLELLPPLKTQRNSIFDEAPCQGELITPFSAPLSTLYEFRTICLVWLNFEVLISISRHVVLASLIYVFIKGLLRAKYQQMLDMC